MGALIMALVIALLSAGTQVITSRVMPGLDRRVRDHAALLKDVPPDMAGSLRDLLRDEVKVLVARERRRQQRGVPVWIQVVRVIGAVAALGVFVVVGVGLVIDPTTGVPAWMVLSAALLTVLGALLALAGLFSILREGFLANGLPEAPSVDEEAHGRAQTSVPVVPN